jgi:monooxygenase
VLVIGSGATAVTMVPGLLKENSKQLEELYPRWRLRGPASYVIMLQRTPTYISPVPQVGAWQIGVWVWLRSFVPMSRAFFVAAVAWTVQLYRVYLFYILRTFPDYARNRIKTAMLGAVTKAYGPERAAQTVAQLGDPPYAVWDQRLAADQSASLGIAVASGRAKVVTAKIKCFDKKGVVLEDVAGGVAAAAPSRIDCDVIVLATGLELLARGGVKISVDGKDVGPMRDSVMYRGCMQYSTTAQRGIPNFFYVFGYWNSAWTLKASLIADYSARVIAAVLASGKGVVAPAVSQEKALREMEPITDMTSGYLQRGDAHLPRQLKSWPFKMYQNYVLDYALLGPLAPTIDTANCVYVELSENPIESSSHGRRKKE